MLSGFKPTRFIYKPKMKRTRVSLGTKKTYPFDWYLGGVDSCQGDSGGPLWRNLEKEGGTRAAQIGVVSRGRGCAAFNAPAIYASVRKAYGWIEETVVKHKSTEDVCKIN